MRDAEAETAPPTNLPSKASQRGLDWFTFFVADLQTGFGPFLSVYLTTQKWTQVDIGLVLAIGSIAGLAGQIPGGWAVDAAKSKRRAAAIAVVAIGLSALIIALSPMFLTIVAAKLLHVAGSSILGPAIAAITLGLVGHAAIGPRLGRNARFSSIGNGVAAAFMGACGYFISAQAVFFVTAVLAIPTVFSVLRIRESEIDPVQADGGMSNSGNAHAASIASVLRKPALLVLLACVLLFHLANAALLPLVGSAMATRSGPWATALVAACIVVPQFIVAVISPTVGELAQTRGRRVVLAFGFGALMIRGALLGLTTDPFMIILVQMLDGISGAVMGILVPLVLADVTRGTGRFNFMQGVAGSATGAGAAASAIAAGYLADNFGMSMAFIGLSSIAGCGLVLLLVLMPETRPDEARVPDRTC